MNRMRIACPSCGAEYDVPDRLLAGPARTLRCSRCGADFALPQAAAAAPVPVPEPATVRAPEPSPAPSMPALPARERAPVASAPPDQAALLRAWVASLVVMIGAMVGLLVFRSEVMAAWLPSGWGDAGLCGFRKSYNITF
jgi:predicted Zn finger-like uncharacterized protein